MTTTRLLIALAAGGLSAASAFAQSERPAPPPSPGYEGPLAAGQGPPAAGIGGYQPAPPPGGAANPFDLLPSGESPDAYGSQDAAAEMKRRESPDAYGGQNAAAEMRRLERELADLNAATQQRRSELMKKLAEAKMREAQAQARAEVEQQASRKGVLRSSLVRKEAVSPEWVIGITIGSSEDESGVKVEHVFENKPAAKAGMRKGDVIVACNGIALHDGQALTAIITAAGGQELTFKVHRAGGEDGAEAVAGEELEFKITPVKNEAPSPEATSRWEDYDLGQPRSWPGYGTGGAVFPDSYATIPQAEYRQLLGVPGSQLEKDNAEIKKLLRELIEEVKKLPKN